MEGIKLVAGVVTIWVIGLVSMGVMAKVMYHVFMVGWNLL